MATNASTNDPNTGTALAEGPQLTQEQETAVFDAAARWLTEATYGAAPSDLREPLGEAADMPLIGAFVTAKRKGDLRSCCGSVGRPLPLAHAVSHAAIRTATDDPRFPPLSPSELAHLDLDVWLLFGMKPVEAQGEDRVEAVEIGRHGLQIVRGRQSGLLLPGVATELGLSSREFLEHVCMKAGLPRDAWMDANSTLYTFEGKEIRAPFEPDRWIDPATVPETGVSEEDVTALASFVRRNLIMLLEGATPSYYLSNVYDGDVLGVTVTVFTDGGGARLELSKFALKPPIPLQATLFELVETAANSHPPATRHPGDPGATPGLADGVDRRRAPWDGRGVRSRRNRSRAPRRRTHRGARLGVEFRQGGQYRRATAKRVRSVWGTRVRRPRGESRRDVDRAGDDGEQRAQGDRRAAAGRGRHVLPRPPRRDRGIAGQSDSRRREEREIRGRAHPPRRLDLFREVGGEDARPHRLPVFGDHLLSPAPSGRIAVGRLSVRLVVAPQRNASLRSRIGQNAGRRDRPPRKRPGRAPGGARHRSRATDDRASRPEDQGRGHRHERRRLGRTGALRRAACGDSFAPWTSVRC